MGEDRDHDERKGRPAPHTVNGPAAVPPLNDGGWLAAAVLSGEVLIPGNDVRSRVFAEVRADRDGSVTRHLLTFAADDRTPVRRTVFELLAQLFSQKSGPPSVADAAAAALAAADPQVRRTAATLLVSTADPDRATAALHACSDPVARIALVDAMTWASAPRHRPDLNRLRSDPVPAIRLLANVALFDRDDPAAWAGLDAAVRADLDASAGVLDAPGSCLRLTAGERWARVLTGFDREEDCYAWVRRLTDPAANPQVRREGVRMAVEAMRQWRAAPARLTPVLTDLLKENPSGVRSSALRALAASVTASRLAADDLAATLDDPELGAPAAVALGSAGDHRAVPHLVRLMLAGSSPAGGSLAGGSLAGGSLAGGSLAGSDEPRLAEAFRAVARAGADPRAPVAAARQILAEQPDPCAAALPMRVLAAFGSAAVAALPELMAMIRALEKDTPDCVFGVLGRIGPAAEAAVPLLRQYSTQGATLALLRITSDRAVADRYLAGRPEQLRHGRLASKLLTWLAGHGGLTARQHRQLRSLFQRPGFGQAESAGAVWLHEGPPAAAELLEVLEGYLSDDMLGPEALRVLTAMGPHALPMVDRLDRFTASRRRAGFSIGDMDAEMRADEMLLAATLDARERIAGVPTGRCATAPADT
ncbi:hypothetical protein AB0F72_21600 [Actinoplanes sp. NPDC023936]|uniref:hypothetical protein n=1 Tax=Actinoplanes sp. NPDC023936 TaxID=3154910 RepID=UPI00340B403B